MDKINPILVEVARGGHVESRHRGAAAVVDSQGRVLAACGETHAPIFPRSAIKPLQALPLLASGAAAARDLSPAHLALACASHSGEPAHVALAAAWLDRLGLTEQHLACGPHPPMAEAAAEALIRTRCAPSRLHNNCSGKHAGFLTTALHLGEPVAGYEHESHPVQRRVQAVLAEIGGCVPSAMPIGIDGCGVPTFGMPLLALARAFARLAHPDGLAAPLAAAARDIVAAMTAHPFHVGGTARFDTRIMQLAEGGIVVKSGAEGTGAAAVPGSGIGIAVKIDDGGKRALETAMAALLLRFAAPAEACQGYLAGFACAPIHNTQGLVVGEIRCVAGAFD